MTFLFLPAVSFFLFVCFENRIFIASYIAVISRTLKLGRKHNDLYVKKIAFEGITIFIIRATYWGTIIMRDYFLFRGMYIDFPIFNLSFVKKGQIDAYLCLFS